MREVILDCRALSDREDFHAAMARKLELPAWYGKNLDALYDCLTDLEEETCLYLLHPEGLADNLGPYGYRILATLREAEEECPRLHIRAVEEKAEI